MERDTGSREDIAQGFERIFKHFTNSHFVVVVGKSALFEDTS